MSARSQKYDAQLGQELETAIVMDTHFSGDPPYVGNAGLVLAVKECGEAYRQRPALIAALERLTEKLAGWLTTADAGLPAVVKTIGDCSDLHTAQRKALAALAAAKGDGS